MVKMNRFIQFNDETVDTKTYLLYERLARALADAPYLELTERKLLEFRPQEGILSMSVFWRHREEQIVHAGRLSDIYLLTAGFWKEFQVPIWIKWSKELQSHPLRKFALELVLMLEEFRYIDLIQRARPGTAQSFQVRIDAYLRFHKDQLTANVQKGFLADALLNGLFLALYEGMVGKSEMDWTLYEIDWERILSIWQLGYDSRSTKDQTAIVRRLIEMLEESIERDLVHQYYALGDAINEVTAPFMYHQGMTDAEKGEPDRKETIEEVFRSWHRESKDESGVHLEYELEHGRSGKSDGTSTSPGDEQAEIEEIGLGGSKGDMKNLSEEEETKPVNREQMQPAGTLFGKEHVHVVYEEKRIQVVDELENRKQLERWREEQKPFVRAFVQEMKKRMEFKQDAKRERLMKGRLSNNLTTLFIDERPRPFYRKNAPSTELDAIFGLLVDGSASMLDKLDETKKAVLLFHDVLRQLDISHEISSYYEDAYNATKERQPNIFERMHTFEDRNRDNGLAILSFDANEDNRDGFAIRWMANRLAGRPEKHKFLLVFSDGEPSAFGYDRNGIVDTAEAVMETEKRGISIIHLFLSTEEPTEEQKAIFTSMFGSKTASSNSVESFADQTLRILRKLLAIVIRTT